ncbi:MAG: hypothetical protein ACI8SK_000376, partial [Shewanella sp.]
MFSICTFLYLFQINFQGKLCSAKASQIDLFCLQIWRELSLAKELRCCQKYQFLFGVADVGGGNGYFLWLDTSRFN